MVLDAFEHVDQGGGEGLDMSKARKVRKPFERLGIARQAMGLFVGDHLNAMFN